MREPIVPAKNGYVHIFHQPKVLLLVKLSGKFLVWNFASVLREVRVLISLIITVGKVYLADGLPCW